MKIYFLDGVKPHQDIRPQAGEVYVPSRVHLADPPMVMQLVPVTARVIRRKVHLQGVCFPRKLLLWSFPFLGQVFGEGIFQVYFVNPPEKASMVRETPKQHRFQAIQNASIGNASA